MWFTGRKRSRLKSQGRTNPEKIKHAGEGASSLDPVQLVGGKFSAVEAADVLISLINDKIRYHTIKTLNLNIAEEDRSRSQKRIDNLRKAKDDIKDLVVRGSKMGKWVEINSTISIKLIDKPRFQTG